jgi:hypothetical protein
VRQHSLQEAGFYIRPGFSLRRDGIPVDANDVEIPQEELSFLKRSVAYSA